MSFKIREVHWDILVEYMTAHPDLARGRLNTSQARKDYNLMWAELTIKLNSVGFGQKPKEKWQKSWSDYKVNLKKKAAEIEHSRLLTGGGPGTVKSLTEFEMKVLSLLGDSFYKGIGVKEVGIITSQERITNSDINGSETLSLEILPKRKPCATKKIEIQASKRAREQDDFEFIEQESMSLLSFQPSKKPMQDILQQRQQPSCSIDLQKPMQGILQRQLPSCSIDLQKPLQDNLQQRQQPSCSIHQKSEIPFRKEIKNKDMANLSETPGTTKKPRMVFNEDHDYLAELAGPSGVKKIPSRRSRNNENDTKKIYEDTVDILHSINNNVSRVANNFENLVSEFKTCSATFKELLENLKPNLN